MSPENETAAAAEAEHHTLYMAIEISGKSLYEDPAVKRQSRRGLQHGHVSS